jgi:hypothetical protein
MRVLVLVCAAALLAGCSGSRSISGNADPFQWRPRTGTYVHGYAVRRHKVHHRRVVRPAPVVAPVEMRDLTTDPAKLPTAGPKPTPAIAPPAPNTPPPAPGSDKPAQ